MMQIEDLGFCSKGEGPDFVRSHDMTVTGDFPHNTSGGQLSAGQAGAAGGRCGRLPARVGRAAVSAGAAGCTLLGLGGDTPASGH
jgi:acetyl-CoA acetyltransferase